ncbi:hypothetical protein FACS1894139_04450 [Planctomycetales bacterium]|nr:hypothetical protein FACS1894107_02110 [Planctomycetales bacterium]GHT01256.1 hypothetical protein FACS1894108_14770 [Planctomycetales bacterium]GHT03653.1 hypothetical protein FACS1894139_04450 [Planctomycetales bacterium]
MKLSQKISRYSARSNRGTLDMQSTNEANCLKTINDNFSQFIEEFATESTDLVHLVAISHTLLTDQKQVVHAESDKKKIAAVQDNYISLINIAKQMQNDGLTYVRTVNNTSEARKDIAALPKSYGVNQINSFIELMKEFAAGQPESIIGKYEAMIALGKKTLTVARETHHEIVQKYEAQIRSCSL